MLPEHVLGSAMVAGTGGDGPAIIPPRQPPEWWINGRNLTEEINAWMAARGVSLPFDEETQAEFILTFWECYQVNA